MYRNAPYMDVVNLGHIVAISNEGGKWNLGGNVSGTWVVM